MSNYSKPYIASPSNTYYDNANFGTRSIIVVNNSRYYMCFNFGGHIVPLGVSQSDWYIPPFSIGFKNIDSLLLCFTWFSSATGGTLYTTPSIAIPGNADITYSSNSTSDSIVPLDAQIEQLAQIQYGSIVLSNIAPGVGGWQDIFVPTQTSYLRFIRIDVTDSASLNGAKFYINITNANHTITYYTLMGKWIYKNTVDDVSPLVWDMRSVLEAITIQSGQVLTVQAIAGLANEVMCSYAFSL